MAVRSYEENGKIYFEVKCSLRSKRHPHIRVQKKVTQIDGQPIKSEAEARRLEKRLKEQIRQEVFQRENQGITWSELLKNWMGIGLNGGFDHLGISESSFIDYSTTLKKHTSIWNGRQASEISRADVIDIYNFLRKSGKSEGTLERLRTAINCVYKWGIDHRKIPGTTVSPTLGIHLKNTPEEKKPEILTIGEIKKLISKAQELENHWRDIWSFALLSGMRNGELFALTWDKVDFENKKIWISESFDKKTRKVKTTKGGYYRQVPFNRDLELLIKKLKLSSGGNSHVLPRIRQWVKGYQAKELREFCTVIGIPSVKFHTLRACWATQLLLLGKPMVQVQKMGGWKTLKTMQIYIRKAGIEVEGGTDGLEILPPEAAGLYHTQEG
jgi:integrase